VSKKIKALDNFAWEEGIRDESITEEVILLTLRCGISDAVKHKQADVAKDLATAYAEIVGVRQHKVGF